MRITTQQSKEKCLTVDAGTFNLNVTLKNGEIYSLYATEKGKAPKTHGLWLFYINPSKEKQTDQTQKTSKHFARVIYGPDQAHIEFSGFLEKFNSQHHIRAKQEGEGLCSVNGQPIFGLVCTKKGLREINLYDHGIHEPVGYIRTNGNIFINSNYKSKVHLGPGITAVTAVPQQRGQEMA